MPDFLLEIGCEEIPARMIAPAQEELAGPGVVVDERKFRHAGPKPAPLGNGARSAAQM